MELKQVSQHIYKLTVETTVGIPIIINTWYILEDGNVYIIDTGMASYSNTQIKVALLLGAPQAIFLTHGHSDHINGAKHLSESLNIPIYAHEKELPYINGTLPYPNKHEIDETGVANKVQPLNLSLDIPFSYYLTPGHAPGHVIYYHNQDDVLICGDLFISDSNALHPPINKFTYDMMQNINSGIVVDTIKPKLITTSHGDDIVYSEEIYPIYKFKYEVK
ncbi:MBL fold metallo-hydrolase [Staphylococcus sp. 18_1_E_LY]|uniref:MBL fold metallo-hydrolase n=1 Tax=Staphylococcus lloydii TaxID=2781774 RepID=A0A7T1B001_9STAP|nr:MBL fold metallo-hydrolase [Staphylococcus lloydii]MBF7019882.1 MBL fold metallo-hydrolase [Staphylococcus lloydii]MBF7027565.1 MBL fold metallo-hydrolase [Staphylococcus lloydii]QPM75254.1 MBL fold metallo-hydrolase [Staphylococcus lloydii]